MPKISYEKRKFHNRKYYNIKKVLKLPSIEYKIMKDYTYFKYFHEANKSYMRWTILISDVNTQVIEYYKNNWEYPTY